MQSTVSHFPNFDVRLHSIYERASCKFRSYSHLINHIDYMFYTGITTPSSRALYRFAVYQTEQEYHWQVLHSYRLPNERIQARNYVLLHSLYATRWEQIEVECSVNSHHIQLIGSERFQLSRQNKLRLLRQTIRLWADARHIDLTQFMNKTSAFFFMIDYDQIVIDRIVIDKFPSKHEPMPPLSINDQKQMESKYGNGLAWRTFSQALCRNPFVKARLLNEQKCICPVCLQKLNMQNSITHHIDYDYECQYIVHKEEWPLLTGRPVPDCEGCSEEHPDWFGSCLKRLRLVHSPCNNRLNHVPFKPWQPDLPNASVSVNRAIGPVSHQNTKKETGPIRE